MSDHLLKPYAVPTKKDICVIFCFYNPCNYKRPFQNLLFFEQKLKQARIPYFCAELLVGDQQPQILNPALLVRSSSALFYKESLFNKIVSKIPLKYNKFIFTDCDLVWKNPYWIDEIWNHLETADICQCFSEVLYLAVNYDVFLRKPSAAKWLLEVGKYQNGKSAPGGAWAMTRKTFNALGGFYEKNVVGGGDVALVCALSGQIPDLAEGRSEIHFSDWKAYVERLQAKLPELKLSYFDCQMYHLYHGNFGNRFYRERYTLLEGKVWDEEFIKNTDDLWELRSEEAKELFLKYFQERKEDGIDQTNVRNSMFKGKQIQPQPEPIPISIEDTVPEEIKFNFKPAPAPPPLEYLVSKIEENKKIAEELEEKIRLEKQALIEKKDDEMKACIEKNKQRSFFSRFPNLDQLKSQ